MEERNCFDARPVVHRSEGKFACVNADLLSIRHVELPKLNEDNAARPRTRRVRCGRWIANIGPGRKIPVLILENPFEHQEFLATTVDVRRELAVWRIAYDRGGASHFATNAVKHATVDSRYWRADP